VGPQQIVNRVDADGVQAYLVLRNGAEFGSKPPAGPGIKSTTITLNAPNRVDGAQLTLAIDVALVTDARQTLRRVLLITGLAALLVSAVLVAAAVRFALRPLDAMAALAKTITEGNRGRRLNPTRTDTEIGQTARAFDEMVDELEGAETAGSEQVLPVEVAAGQTSEIPPLSAQHACPHALQQCVGVPASGKMVLPPRIGCEHG